MATIGKHTGTGRLLFHDEGGGELLYDPGSGDLLYDGDVWFNRDPEEGEIPMPEPWHPDDYVGWVAMDVEWGRRFYAERTWTGLADYTAPQRQRLLNNFYPASDPANMDTRTAQGYQFVNSATSSMNAVVSCGARLFALPSVDPGFNQHHRTPTRIDVHGLRAKVQLSGTGNFEARWRYFGSVPSYGLHGGATFLSANIRRRQQSYRTCHINFWATYAYGDAPWIYTEARPRSLRHNTVSGGQGGYAFVQSLDALCVMSYQ